MPDIRIVASDLQFPEGPVATSDGTLYVCEIRGGRISCVAPDGTRTVLANMGGGPNGLAFGPDGALYACNNGGGEYREGQLSSIGPARSYAGGYIQRVDPATGEFRTLYTHCDEHRLSSPNDIVFDSHGGFYFTDSGKRHSRTKDHGGLYYAQADGSRIVEIAYQLGLPNGIGLSPDGKVLYVADTMTSRLIAFDLNGPGVIKPHSVLNLRGARLVCGLPGYQWFDGLAVAESGNIAVATLITGQITVISPTGEILRSVDVGDYYVTNICFGGPLRRTAYITMAAGSQLGAMDWDETGLALNYAC